MATVKYNKYPNTDEIKIVLKNEKVSCDCCCPRLGLDITQEEIIAITVERNQFLQKCPSFRPRPDPPFFPPVPNFCKERIESLAANSKYVYETSENWQKELKIDYSDKPDGGRLHLRAGRLWTIKRAGSCLHFLYRSIIFTELGEKIVLNDPINKEGQSFGSPVTDNRLIWSDVIQKDAQSLETENGCYLYVIVFHGWVSFDDYIENPDYPNTPYKFIFDKENKPPILHVPSSKNFSFVQFRIRKRKKEGGNFIEPVIQYI